MTIQYQDPQPIPGKAGRGGRLLTLKTLVNVPDHVLPKRILWNAITNGEKMDYD